MVESLKNVVLRYDPLKRGEFEALRVYLKVICDAPYVSSVCPSRVILWLSRRYHVVSSYFAMQNSNSFVLTALIICDEEYFRCWSHKKLLEYVAQVIR